MALSGDSAPRFDHDALIEARRAARRAGMSLGDWLEAVFDNNAVSGTTRKPREDPGSSTSDAIAAIRARLDELERRNAASRDSAPRETTRLTQDVVRRLEERLDAIARRGQAGGQVENSAASSDGQSEETSSESSERQSARPAEPRQDNTEPIAPPPPAFDDRPRISTADLGEAVAEITERQKSLERDLAQTLDTHADRMDHRLDGVTDRLQRSIEESSPRSAMRDLEEEIRTLAGRAQGGDATIDSELREEFRALVHRLDELPPQIAEEMAPRLEDTFRRLDTATRSELDSLRTEMRELAKEIDQATRSGLDSLHAEIAKLSARFDESLKVPQAGEMGLDAASRAELAALREEIQALGNQVDGAHRDSHAAIQEELRALVQRLDTESQTPARDIEQHLDNLAERLGESRTEAGDKLAEVERQLVRLAERFDATGEQPGATDGLEQRIGELARQLEDSRASSTGVTALKEELAELKSSISDADKRNQDTLKSVTDTLNRIAERLADLEEEVEDFTESALKASRRQAAAPEAETDPEATGESLPEPPPQAAPERDADPDDIMSRIEAVTRTFHEDRDDHTPLAPGSGRPMAEAAAEVPDAGDAQATAAKDDREDFIAAARRAAQQASTESNRDDTRGSRTDAAGGVLDILKTYRRPLLITTALIVIALGAAKGAEFLMASRGGDEPVTPAANSLGDAAGQGDDEAADVAPRNADPADATSERVEPTAGPRVIDQSADDRITTSSIKGTEGMEGDDAAGAGDPASQAATLPPAEIGSERLSQAAAEGDTAAWFEIARRYTEGEGVDQDFAKAAKWYRLAAAQGLAPAQYRLGSLYERGHGVEADPAMARTWYRRAAEQGNRTAMHNLAVLHAEGADSTPDYERAAQWFRQSSEYGLADSQYNLAVLHARGLGVEQDFAASYRWFARAAEQGDDEAARQRDAIAERLAPEAVEEAKLAVQSWQAKPLIAEANTVPEPEGGWDVATTAEEPATNWSEISLGPADDGETAARTPLGENADLIRRTQQRLDALGFDPGPVDGRAGRQTREAIIEFQDAAGLPKTGQTSEDLLERLNQESG